jgi:hypothetical protein
MFSSSLEADIYHDLHFSKATSPHSEGFPLTLEISVKRRQTSLTSLNPLTKKQRLLEAIMTNQPLPLNVNVIKQTMQNG